MTLVTIRPDGPAARRWRVHSETGPAETTFATAEHAIREVAKRAAELAAAGYEVSVTVEPAASGPLRRFLVEEICYWPRRQRFGYVEASCAEEAAGRLYAAIAAGVPHYMPVESDRTSFDIRPKIARVIDVVRVSRRALREGEIESRKLAPYVPVLPVA